MALHLSLIQTANSSCPIITGFCSIKWFHSVHLASPTDSHLVINIVESAKRKLYKPVCKKEPVTPELLEKKFMHLFMGSNVKNLRIICACLIGYAGFLRSNELLNIKCCDIVIDNTHMSIFIESSKTDKCLDGI